VTNRKDAPENHCSPLAPVKSRDAVETAIDLAKEHFSGTWETHLHKKQGRIQRWRGHLDTTDADDHGDADPKISSG